MYDFISDLDEFFCEKYANYDKLCVLSDYEMPTMYRTETDEFGVTRSYTLEADTMSLARQKKKTELLAALKTKLADTSFSFSFLPLGIFARLRNRFSKVGFYKPFHAVLQRYDVPSSAAEIGLSVSEEIWRKICKGSFLPTKNLIFSLALAAHFSYEDTCTLLTACGYAFDFTSVKDVVLAYLLQTGVYNAEMVACALAEYRVENLYLAQGRQTACEKNPE